ncbi:MAG TPA: beta-propeller fold lactonase family protein [Gemmatimonadaceae bacterium]|nr:beta-propeller fold lactonase family protein [Gemmatimonadaceae bacterium]
MSMNAGSLRLFTRLSALVGIAALAACSDQSSTNPLSPNQAVASRGIGEHGSDEGAVFVTTNGVNGNEVKAFSRAADGSLSPLGTFATGGNGVGGTGDPLTSQGAAALSPDHQFLFVVNAGSNDVSVFRIKKDGLKLVERTQSGGQFPNSVAVTDDAVYVLNANSSNVGIFSYNESGNLHARGTAALSPNTAGPTEARVSPNGRWLDVTERASNTIDAFRISEDGRLGAPVKTENAGNTPFGFQFTPKGVLVVSEAGTASASSYDQAPTGSLTAVSSAVSNGGQAAPCWLIVDPRGHYAYTANAGGSSISGYAIDNDGHLTLITPGGRTGDLGVGANPLDIDFGGDGRFLYVLKNGTGTVGAFTVNSDGTLTPLPDTPGLVARAGYMGLAAF